MSDFLWPTGKPHISFSEISTWMECPYRYKLINVDKLGSFNQTPHLSLGTGVHDANENYIKTRVMDKSIAFAVIEKSWKDNEERFTKGPFPEWASKGFGALEDWIARADMLMNDVPAFLETEFPGWVCHNAEELLYEELAGHPLKFKGLVDAIIIIKDKRGKNQYWIIDWKTCGWGWSRDKKQDPKVLLQLILYKNFWAKKHNIPLKDIRCGFALLKRDGKPGKSISLVPVSVGPTTSARGLKIIDNHIRAVSKGMFLKNRNSCFFCEFKDTGHCPSDL